MTIDKRQQTLGIIAAIAIVLLAGDSFVLTPLIKSWKARSTQADDLRRKIDRGTKLSYRRQAVREDWDAMRTNTLPAEKSTAESLVYKAVDAWSKDSGVSLTSIKSTWKKDADEYETVDFRVDATGNLQSVTKFLYDKESSPLGLKVDSVEIRALDATGRLFELGVMINGLRLNSPQP